MRISSSCSKPRHRLNEQTHRTTHHHRSASSSQQPNPLLLGSQAMAGVIGSSRPSAAARRRQQQGRRPGGLASCWAAAGAVLLCLLLLGCLAPTADAQWGMKRKEGQKKDGAVRPEDVPGGLTFDELQKIAKHQSSNGGGRGLAGLGADSDNPLDLLAGLGDLGDLDMGKLVNEAFNSPEIQAMMRDPEKMKQALKDSPIFENLPGLDKILDRPEFNDPEQLQEISRKGVEEFKEISDKVFDLVSDPQKREEVMAELTKTLDPAEQDKMRRLMGGDPELVEEAAANLAEAFASAGAEFKKSLSDPEKMEAARQAFLENEEWQNTFDDPDLQAMASDPDKWREVMMQNARLLYATADDSDQKEEL